MTWNHKADVWSIGCIVLELLTGDLFFQTHNEYEHLALIERACGPIPYWMAKNCDREYEKFFNFEKENSETYYNWPELEKSESSILKVQKMKTIDDILCDEEDK